MSFRTCQMKIYLMHHLFLDFGMIYLLIRSCGSIKSFYVLYIHTYIFFIILLFGLVGLLAGDRVAN